MVINRDDIFNQAEAGYFHPKIDQRDRHPDAGRRRRSSRRSTRARRTRSTSTGAKALLTGAGFTYDGNTLEGPDRQAGDAHADRPGRLVRLHHRPRDHQGQPVADRHRRHGRQGQPGRLVQVRRRRATSRRLLHWTNGGATPYDIYQTIMDGDRCKPIGTGRHQRQLRPLQQRPRRPRRSRPTPTPPTTPARTTAMNTLQKIFVEQMPMIPRRRGQRRRRVQRPRTGPAGPTTPTRTAPRSRPSPTRWTSSCT